MTHHEHDEHLKEAEQRPATDSADGVRLWGHRSTHAEFLEGRYGAESDAEAERERAGTPAVTDPETIGDVTRHGEEHPHTT